jgi:hypothetical protein
MVGDEEKGDGKGPKQVKKGANIASPKKFVNVEQKERAKKKKKERQERKKKKLREKLQKESGGEEKDDDKAADEDDEKDDVKDEVKGDENDNDSNNEVEEDDDDDGDGDLLAAAANWATQKPEEPEEEEEVEEFDDTIYSLHLTQLSYDTSDFDVRTLFERKGCIVTSVRLVYDHSQYQKTFRGVAFVDVVTKKSYENALSLDRAFLLGRRINVRPTKSKEELADIVARTKEMVEKKIQREREKADARAAGDTKDGDSKKKSPKRKSGDDDGKKSKKKPKRDSASKDSDKPEEKLSKKERNKRAAIIMSKRRR